MTIYTVKGMVYDTVVCGEKCTCLYKIFAGLTEDEQIKTLEEEKKLTGLNLRIEEVETW